MRYDETKETLLRQRITQEDMPVCLAILEAAVMSARMEHAVPPDLMEMISAFYGGGNVQAVLYDLERLEILVEGMPRLAPDCVRPVSALLADLIGSMELDGRTVSVFLEELTAYITGKEPGIEVGVSELPGAVALTWEEKQYELLPAFSPFFMPVAADWASEAERYLYAIGPFAGQHWEKLYPYYEHPEFRDYLALYDPWGQRKMNISNGHLSAFLDWFVRDRSGRRFYVEPSFTEAIHDLGLLRYDDES